MATGLAAEPAKGSALAKPNGLLILVDDLNDWVAPIGGHPLAQTPYLVHLRIARLRPKNLPEP